MNNEVENLIPQINSIDVQLVGASPDATAALKAQRIAIVNQACGLYFQLRGNAATPDVVAFAATNCH